MQNIRSKHLYPKNVPLEYLGFRFRWLAFVVFFCLFAPFFSFSAYAQSIPLPVVRTQGAFTIRAEAGMEDVAQKLLEAAPGFWRAIQADLPPLANKDIEIRLVRRSSSLPKVAPKGHSAPSWAVGVAYAAVGVVSVAHIGPDNSLHDPLMVAAHELAHLALDKALPQGVPRWLNEGFANLHSSEWSMARTQVLVGLAWSGNVIPLEQLDQHFPREEYKVHKAYAQSYSLVSFLAQRGRYQDTFDNGNRWPFQNFLRFLAEGKTLENAAKQAYGRSMQELFAEWQTQLQDRFMLIPSNLFELFIWLFGAVLLVLGYLRKRKINKTRLMQWEEEEALVEEHEEDFHYNAL